MALALLHTSKSEATVHSRHAVNSIPELELMVKPNSNSGFGIDYFKKWNWN